ncbi:hypothetical protein N7465_010784 [Penicillium sp. CMV-2018d]|nr:hypothetical protein N7465_010784 [Penicillium sp. CMV-2018d]
MTFSQSSSVTPAPLDSAWPPAHIWETMGAADQGLERTCKMTIISRKTVSHPPPEVKPLIDIFPGVSAALLTRVFERKLKATELIRFKEKSVTELDQEDRVFKMTESGGTVGFKKAAASLMDWGPNPQIWTTCFLTYLAVVGYRSKKQFRYSSNHHIHEPGITAKLAEDLNLGRVRLASGPSFVSPLGLVPKQDGGWRRIHDLSWPPGQGLNQGIPDSWSAIEYMTIDNIYEQVIQAGPGCATIKRDIKYAFRIVPIAEDNHHLLAFRWNGSTYVECCLPFGLATAPFLFNLFAEALHWILHCLLPAFYINHYLDDFIAIARSPSVSDPTGAFDKVYNRVTDYLRIPRNTKKDQQGTCVTVLGIQMDSIAMEARLPPEKLCRATLDAAAALNAASVSLKQTKRLTGLFAFCSRVVRLGRTRLQSLYTFQAAFPQGSSARRRIPYEVRDDLEWWRDYLSLQRRPLGIEPPAWFSSRAPQLNTGHLKLPWNGLIANTRSVYLSVQRNYEKHCALQNIPAWPVSRHFLTSWLSARLLGDASHKAVKPDTALADLAALRAYHIDNFLDDKLFDNKHFRRLIDGARRLSPVTKIRVRKPISRDTITKLSGSLAALPPRPLEMSGNLLDDLNFATVCRVAFAGFLRLGEFTYKADDLSTHSIFSATKLTPPTGPDAPLFSFHRRPFSRNNFLSTLSTKLRVLGLRTEGYSGHSFRKGAAQHAHDSGILGDQIQMLGRWTSEAFRVYFTTNASVLYKLNHQFQTGSPAPLSLLLPPPSFPTAFQSGHATPVSGGLPQHGFQQGTGSETFGRHGPDMAHAHEAHTEMEQRLVKLIDEEESGRREIQRGVRAFSSI